MTKITSHQFIRASMWLALGAAILLLMVALVGMNNDTYTAAPPCESSCIVFYTDRDGDREIFTMNPDGSSPTNISYDPADDVYPSWSPNGSKIAFATRAC